MNSPINGRRKTPKAYANARHRLCNARSAIPSLFTVAHGNHGFSLQIHTILSCLLGLVPLHWLCPTGKGTEHKRHKANTKHKKDFISLPGAPANSVKGCKDARSPTTKTRTCLVQLCADQR